MTLTDTHLVLLSAAAQHADRLLVRPDALTDKAAQTLAADEPSAPDETGVAADQQPASSHNPRPGTKQARIIALLRRAAGASLDELIAATGWLPHTTRAALTGLRQKGYVLAKSTGEDGRTRYRISDPEHETASRETVAG